MSAASTALRWVISRLNSRFEAASSTVRWLNVSMNFFSWTAASRALRCVFSIGVIATAKKIPACLMSAARLPAGQPGNTSVTRICSCSLARSSVCSPAASAWPPSAARRFQAGLPALLQVRSQRRLVASGQFEKLRFISCQIHAATRRTDSRRFYHQPLRAGDFIFETLGVAPGLLFQGEQPDIDAQQSLGDFILKFAADLFAFILLRRQHLMRQLPQTFLQLQRFLQQFGVVLPPLFLRAASTTLAPDDAPLQLAVGGGQFLRAPAQRRHSAGSIQLLLCRAARCVSSIGVLASVKKISARLVNPFLLLG